MNSKISNVECAPITESTTKSNMKRKKKDALCMN